MYDIPNVDGMCCLEQSSTFVNAEGCCEDISSTIKFARKNNIGFSETRFLVITVFAFLLIVSISA